MTVSGDDRRSEVTVTGGSTVHDNDGVSSEHKCCSYIDVHLFGLC